MIDTTKIYEAINQMPAMLAAKGRAMPRAKIEFEANTDRVYLWLSWRKECDPRYPGEEIFKACTADTPDGAIAKAIEEIEKMPSMKDENTRAFMQNLGNMIDQGRAIGIEVEYLNPLVESMKRLSEHILTYDGPTPRAPAVDDDDMPF